MTWFGPLTRTLLVVLLATAAAGFAVPPTAGGELPEGLPPCPRAVPTVTPFTTIDYCLDWHGPYHTWSAGTCPAGATVQE